MFLVFCSVQMTQTRKHTNFIPFLHLIFFSVFWYLLNKIAHIHCAKTSLSTRLVFFMSNYAGWDEKRHIRCKFACDANFRSQTKETGTKIVKADWQQKSQSKKRPIEKKADQKKGRSKDVRKAVQKSRSKRATQKSSISNNSVHFKLCNSDKSNKKKRYLVFWCDLFYFFLASHLLILFSVIFSFSRRLLY